MPIFFKGLLAAHVLLALVFAAGPFLPVMRIAGTRLPRELLWESGAAYAFFASSLLALSVVYGLLRRRIWVLVPLVAGPFAVWSLFHIAHLVGGTPDPAGSQLLVVANTALWALICYLAFTSKKGSAYFRGQ